MSLTQEQYARLYTVLAACTVDYCLAPRGVMCRTRAGKQSPTFWHGVGRAQAVDQIRRKRPAYYKKMRAQLLQDDETKMIGGGC